VKHNVMLTITSLLSILLMTFHFADDILLGMSPGAATIRVAVPTLLVWLYGTLMLAERRSGYVIILVGSLGASAMPLVHTTGAGIGKSSGFFFVWTLIALGVTGIFSVILAARGLWSLPAGQPR
jgi:hypothetical protein